MKRLLDRLRDGEVLVSDGAMGTMLFERGLESGGCPEEFNIKRPEVVSEIARMYQEAGADIVHTNTFGGSVLKLAKYNLDEVTEEINITAVKAARDGVGDRAYVSMSCGPSGELLKPYGDVDPEAMYESFERQLKAADKAAADLITVETMIDLTEATLAVEAAKAAAPDLPVIATMTMESTPKGYRTLMGTSVADAVAGLEEAGADIVGSNCGNGSERMIEIAVEIKKHTGLPIAIQPNAGFPELVGGEVFYPETPEFMAEKSQELLAIGVSIIGGCCGTTPEHIKAIARLVRSFKL